MEFKDKLRYLRKKKGYTQDIAAEKLGITTRTYKNYELGHSRPRYRKIYIKMTEIFDVNLNYLLTEDSFLEEAGNKYGKAGVKQAQNLLNQIGALFSGGELSDKDKDAVMIQMQQIYWDAKKEEEKNINKGKNE